VDAVTGAASCGVRGGGGTLILLPPSSLFWSQSLEDTKMCVQFFYKGLHEIKFRCINNE
jgi:hypothetical protein